MNYQEALDKVKELTTKMYADFVYRVATKGSMALLESEIGENLDILQQLIDEKLEQKSRKKFLKVDSKWECVGECYGDGAFLKRNEVVTFVRKSGKFDVVQIEKENSNDTYMPTQQFLLCFKPIKEEK